jgi:hypothetical protein
MTDEEKKADKDAYVRGGYLKEYEYKDACRIMWDKLTNSEKQSVYDIPNFDAAKFEMITGIKIKRC